MKAYVITTGTIFALITCAHVFRIFAEGHGVIDPWFIGLTALTAGLAFWSWQVWRRLSRN